MIEEEIIKGVVNTGTSVGLEKTDPRSEKIEISPYHFKDLAFWNNLFVKGVIKSIPGGNLEENYTYPFSIDFKQVIYELEGFKTEAESEVKSRLSDAEKEDLKTYTQRLFPQVVDIFVAQGILPEKLRKHVDKLVDPDGIEVVEGLDGVFLYPAESFPDDVGEKPSFLIGPNIKEQGTSFNRHRLQEYGIELSDEDIKEAKTKATIGHEYGHVIDKAIRILQRERQAGNSSEDTSFFGRMNKELDADIEVNIAPDDCINQLIEDNGEVSLRGICSKERMATGFENIVLESVLKEKGCLDKGISVAMDLYNSGKERRLNELRLFISDLRQRGVSLGLLDKITMEMEAELYSLSREDLLSIFPSFDLKEIGYSKPLSHDQLKQYISKYTEGIY